MRALIEQNIDWDVLSGHDKSQYTYEITEAVIESETGVLTISLRLNFIMPCLSMAKLKGVILHQIEALKDVKFKYNYENVILSEEEIIPLFIPHMIEIINGKYAAITKSIESSKFICEGEKLQIYALGRLATEQLNEKVAYQFKQLLAEHFGIHKDVTFVNDEDSYMKAAESWIESEESDIKASLEEAKKAAQMHKSESAKPAAGGGFGGNNGNSGGNSGFGGQNGGFKRREKETPAEGNRIMGKDIFGEAIPMSGLEADTGTVILEGILFKKDARPIRNEKKLVTLLITDKKTSVCLKTFCSNNKWEEIDSLLKSGDFIKVRGETEWDRYDNCLTVMIKDINKGKVKKRKDTYEGGKRVELHAHTKMSAMDGLNEVANLVKTAAAWGQPAVAITDHGVVQSFPDAAKTAKKLAGDKENPVDIKIIYGMEGYVFDDRDCHNEDGSIDYKKNPTNHIILLAKTQEGLKNIYKL